MILLDLPARATCDHEKCTAYAPTKLALLVTGTLGFQLLSPGWQVLVDPKNPGMCRCPEHHETPQRVVTAEKNLIQFKAGH
jgi:hypothetical protein